MPFLEMTDSWIEWHRWCKWHYDCVRKPKYWVKFHGCMIPTCAEDAAAIEPEYGDVGYFHWELERGKPMADPAPAPQPEPKSDAPVTPKTPPEKKAQSDTTKDAPILNDPLFRHGR